MGTLSPFRDSPASRNTLGLLQQRKKKKHFSWQDVEETEKDNRINIAHELAEVTHHTTAFQHNFDAVIELKRDITSIDLAIEDLKNIRQEKEESLYRMQQMNRIHDEEIFNMKLEYTAKSAIKEKFRTI